MNALASSSNLDEEPSGRSVRSRSRSQEEIRRIQAEIYLSEGYISPLDLDATGLPEPEVDPYVARSRYFHVDQGRVAVARQIAPERILGIGSLPIAEHFSCNPAVLKKVAGVDHLSELGRGDVVEISGLAATEEAPYADGSVGPVIELYLWMLRESVEQGHCLWVMSTDHRLTDRLAMFPR